LKILVTGAEGFVGSRLVPRLLAAGHEAIAGVHPAVPEPSQRFAAGGKPIRIVPLEIGDAAAVGTALAVGVDAVIHLAAVASGADARSDPPAAWRVNAEGTALLAESIAGVREQGDGDPLLLVISTAEVYGTGPRIPRKETDPVSPCSPYGASKLGAEIAALEVHRRAGLRVVIARAFPHTGAGQTERYVVPALAARIRAAKRAGVNAVSVGNLDVTRELMHVDDVIDAYTLLLERGVSGETYNVASGEGVSLQEVFRLLCQIMGHWPRPEVHPSLMRAADIPYLVGDAAKLRTLTGWKPSRTLEYTLRDVVHAQTD